MLDERKKVKTLFYNYKDFYQNTFSKYQKTLHELTTYVTSLPPETISKTNNFFWTGHDETKEQYFSKETWKDINVFLKKQIISMTKINEYNATLPENANDEITELLHL